ncbi:MAG: 6-phosphofructokinase, partial [Bacteroidales bacterium]|nr:6-phosphofructokinase [Bacteroidales bacterium]
MQESIAIVCGGGPAPGINAVISSISRAFLRSNFKVIGIHQGYKGLFSKDRETIDIDFKFA